MLPDSYSTRDAEDTRRQLYVSRLNQLIRIMLVAIVICALLAMFVFFHVPSVRWTVTLATWAKDSGWIGMAAFAAIDALFVSAMIPGMVFTLLAGAIWGPWLGFLVALTGKFSGAMGGFLLARYVFGYCGSSLFSIPYANEVDEILKEQGWKYSLLLRVAPMIPYNILNYTLALSSLNIMTYMWTTFVGMIPGTMLVTFLGSTAGSITAAIDNHDGEWNKFHILEFIVGGTISLSILYLVYALLKREIQRRMPQL